MGKGGKYLDQVLKEAGLPGAKPHRDAARIGISGIKHAPEGHDLFNVRSRNFDPARNQKDRELVDSMKREGWRPQEPGLFWRDGADVFPVVGTRRTCAAFIARDELRAEGVLGPDDDLMVCAVVKSGTMADLLPLRLGENSGRDKVPDLPIVLASLFRRLVNLGREPEEIAAHAPVGIDAEIVLALCRWDDLHPRAAQRFDAGEMPLDVLPVVLEVAQSKQLEAMNLIEGAGAKTARKARQVVRQSQGKVKERGRVLSRVVVKRQLEALPSSPGLDGRIGPQEAARRAGVLDGFRAGLEHTMGNAKAREVLPADMREALEEAAKPRPPGPRPKGGQS